MFDDRELREEVTTCARLAFSLLVQHSTPDDHVRLKLADAERACTVIVLLMDDLDDLLTGH